MAQCAPTQRLRVIRRPYPQHSLVTCVPKGRARGYQATSGWTDSVKNIGGGLFDIFASAEQAKGASAVLTAQQQGMLQQQGGISPMTILLLGGAGLGLFLLLRKKKSA